MTKKVTTLEQSKRLLDAGLNPNTADLYYTIFDGNCVPHLVLTEMTDRHWKDLCPRVYTPCWSVGALFWFALSKGNDAVFWRQQILR